MGARFEVGRSYKANDSGLGCIKVLKRTEKSIRVRNDNGTEWMMRIKNDPAGNEYVTDSCVPQKWRYLYTYEATEE